MSKRLAVFNHKNVVGKTTTTYNLGWMLSKKYNILVIDADPQCNLSSLFLGDDFEKYYIDEATRHNNIKDGVSVTFLGRTIPLKAVDCYSLARAPTLFLLPGHANLAEYDASLSFVQNSHNAIWILQNLPGAFSEFFRLIEEKYNIDFTIIDINPSLSAINQNLFLASHAFLIPINHDPFSIMTIQTLRTILPRWAEWKKSSFDLFADSAYPLLDGLPKFIGSIIQQFNIRNGKSARHYRNNIEEIKNELSTNFLSSIRSAGMALSEEQYGKDIIDHQYCLAEIADFQSLLPKSYQAQVPIFELTNHEIGETGSILLQLIEKRDLFEKQFNKLTDSVVALMAHA